MKMLRNSLLFGILMIHSVLPLFSQEDINFQLLEACADSSLEKAIACVEKDADVNTRTEYGYTPLMYACDLGHTDLAMYLLDHGASINDSSGFDWNSPLLFAAMQNHFDLCELLIRRGAAINQKNYTGMTALHVAVQNHNYDLAEMLLYYEADIHAIDGNGNTPLHLAASSGDQEMCYILLINGAALETKNSDGETPLLTAANAGQSSCALYLIENGADRQITSINGINLLQSACLSGNYELADSLIAAGFDLNQKLVNKIPLHYYARLRQNNELEKYLKSKGIKNFQGLFIDKVILAMDNTFNLNDYFMGGEVGIHESYTNTSISFGINGRLSREAVLVDQQPITQFWEHRMNLHFAAQKQFRLMAYKHESTGVYLGAKELLSIGWWDGTSQNPGIDWIFAPSAGMYLEGEHFFGSTGIEYFKIANNSASPFHINIRLGIYISDPI